MIKIFVSEEIKTPFNDDIVAALCNVNHHYIHVQLQNKEYAERIFAYEFYHQYRKIMEEKPQYYPDGEVFLNGEQPKGFEDNFGKVNMSPDIVFHGDYNKVIEDKQYWIAELKMSTNAKILDDIEKLESYCSGSLKFQNAYLIVAGTDKDVFCKQWREKLKDITITSQVIIIIYNKDSDNNISLYCDRMINLK